MADDAAPLRLAAPQTSVPVTASGRRRLTREDMFAMMRAGVLDEGERTELIEGELLVMAGEGDAHIDDTKDLMSLLARALGPPFYLESRSPLNIRDATQVAPDIVVWSHDVRARERFPENVRLIVEISDTTRRKDMGVKARLFAGANVPEYWVLDVVKRELWVHRGPGADGWRERFTLADSFIAPLCAPDAMIDVSSLNSAR